MTSGFLAEAERAIQLAEQADFEGLRAADPATAVVGALGAGWSCVGRYVDRAAAGREVDPYEVLILSRADQHMFAALLVHVESPSGVPLAGRWAMATRVERAKSLVRALMTAAAAQSLLELMTKLQRQSLIWPASGVWSFAGIALNAPRLGGCRAILGIGGEEVDRLCVMVGLGDFVGSNRFLAPEPLDSRLRWHQANETVLRHAEGLAELYERWRVLEGLPVGAPERPELRSARRSAFGQQVVQRLVDQSCPLEVKSRVVV